MTRILTIAEVEREVQKHGVSLDYFWREAADGFKVPLPRPAVMKAIQRCWGLSRPPR